MSNKLIMFFVILLIIGGGIFLIKYPDIRNKGIITGYEIAENSNAQIVKMHVEGSKYILEPSTIKKGIPVRIEADISRMPGCSKSIVIPAFNEEKYLAGNPKGSAKKGRLGNSNRPP